MCMVLFAFFCVCVLCVHFAPVVCVCVLCVAQAVQHLAVVHAGSSDGHVLFRLPESLGHGPLHLVLQGESVLL